MNMSLEQVKESAAFLRKEGLGAARIGVILGTGLGENFLKKLKIEKSIDYKDIPHFPLATVEFHSGKLHYASLPNQTKLLAMQGRFHYYEGYSMQQISFPVRVLKYLGIENLLISNAAGNMNPKWHKGELMLITDHINLQPDNPLRGPNWEELGPRFPDMSAPYSAKLNMLLLEIASQKKITLRTGVYASVMGPNLETAAEYRYLQRIGADAVGMSTVPEVIAATHMSLPVCALSVLTDDCDPDNLKPISIKDVIATAAQAEKKLSELYWELMLRL